MTDHTAPLEPDPVLALLGELEQANEAIRRDEETYRPADDDKFGCDADKKTDALVDQRIDIERRIAKTSGCSPFGALAKLRIIVQSWREAENDPEIPAWADLDLNDNLIVSAMRDLECATGERPAP